MFYLSLVSDKASKEYEDKVRSGKADKATYNAGWKVEELSRLNEEGRRIVVELKVLIQSAQVDKKIDKSHKLYKIGNDLTAFIRGKEAILFVHDCHKSFFVLNRLL